MLKGKERNLSFGIIALIIVLFLTIGYSAFERSLLLDDIALTVRPIEDIRVTGTWYKESNNAEVSSTDYNVKHLLSTVTLSEENSTVTYRVEITNIGNVEMGIYDIAINNENLEVEITSDYKMKDKLCVEDQCNLGVKKEIEVTIKYKKESFAKNNTTYDVLLTFDFRPYHTVTYTDFAADTSFYPQEVMDRDNFEMTLTHPYPVGAMPFINGEEVEYHYEGDTLIVENVTGNLEIKSNYIQYIEDLVALSNNVNNGDHYDGKNIILTRDLDFASSDSYRNSERKDFGDINGNTSQETLLKELTTVNGFKPIGFDLSNNRSVYFSGTFDGKENTIRSLYINNKTATASVGLFGAIDNATISNLRLYGEIKTTVNANMGAVSGRAYENIVIDNIENHVNVTGFSNSGSNGGILGSTNEKDTDAGNNITIKNTKNYGNVSDGNQVGGIVAWLVGTVTIENCYNFGTMTLNSRAFSNSGLRAGGLVGATTNGAKLTSFVIKESANFGDIYGGSKSGGLVGAANSSSNTSFIIVNSYNTGKVSGLSAGGIIGYDSGDTYIYNSANLETITSLVVSGFTDYASGVVGINENNNHKLTINNVYTSGQVSGKYSYGVMYSYNSISNFTSESVYYPKNQLESNLRQVYGLYTSEEMKLSSFVDVMNRYVASNPTVTILGTEYPLSNWVMSDFGYPLPQN